MNDGTVMCDGSESHVRHGQGLSSCKPGTKEASARSRPGILNLFAWATVAAYEYPGLGIDRSSLSGRDRTSP